MKRLKLVLPLLLAGTAVSVLAQDGPTSLLPPGFEAPQPSPSPSARPTGRTGPPVSETPAPAVSGGPANPAPAAQPAAARPVASGSGIPGNLTGDALAQAILKKIMESRPRFDVPPGAQRSLAEIGVAVEGEGGLPATGFAGIDGGAMLNVLAGTRGPILSRWGQIVLRRALVTRQPTPRGMNPADWAALRSNLLLRMGEADAARALVQQVDVNDYTPALSEVALAAYAATSDFLGLCPISVLQGSRLTGEKWYHVQAICSAYGLGSGNGMQALDRAMNRGIGTRIDILLAQKFAGAAGDGKRAVTIEWNDVKDMTPWRYGLALADGVIPPSDLMKGKGEVYSLIAARSPVLPPADRLTASDAAGARGVMSSRSMVDLYGLAFEDPDLADEWANPAAALRDAYVAEGATAKVSALKKFWGDDADPQKQYSRYVASAYAAARIPPSDAFSGDSGAILAAMLTAGLDRNAARWAGSVKPGTLGWALVSLANPQHGRISASEVSDFAGNDKSTAARKTRFLAAGLAGLGRLSDGDAKSVLSDHGVDLGRQTKWTRAIDDAARRQNALGVAYLAGLGMQGKDWSKMTSLYLYHIVSALRQVGLEGEARMIAAEAVARA